MSSIKALVRATAKILENGKVEQFGQDDRLCIQPYLALPNTSTETARTVGGFLLSILESFCLLKPLHI